MQPSLLVYHHSGLLVLSEGFSDRGHVPRIILMSVFSYHLKQGIHVSLEAMQSILDNIFVSSRILGYLFWTMKSSNLISICWLTSGLVSRG